MVIPHGVPQHYKHVEFYYKKCPLLVAEEGGLLPLLVWAAPENSGLLPLHSEKEQQKRPLYGKALGKQPITPPFLTFMFIAFGLGMFYNSFPCPFDSLSVAFLTRVDTTSQEQLLSGLKQAVLQLSTC